MRRRGQPTNKIGRRTPWAALAFHGDAAVDYFADYIGDTRFGTCTLTQAGTAVFQGFLAKRKWPIRFKNWRRRRDSHPLYDRTNRSNTAPATATASANLAGLRRSKHQSASKGKDHFVPARAAAKRGTNGGTKEIEKGQVNEKCPFCLVAGEGFEPPTPGL
jgi:hypothetical protein